MTNREKFAQAMTEALGKAIDRNPSEYAYGKEEIPGVVVKMVPALANGSACLGRAGKAAARKCGINPTLKAIKAYLNEGSA